MRRCHLCGVYAYRGFVRRWLDSTHAGEQEPPQGAGHDSSPVLGPRPPAGGDGGAGAVIYPNTPEAEAFRTCALRAEGIRGLTFSECHERRVCAWCGDPLSPRGQRWCPRRASRDRATCAQEFWRNHGWSWARDEAIRRSSGYPFFIDADPNLHYGSRFAEGSCDECGSRSSLEVNHVEPRNGGGYGDGCHHHQTNLQVLCHDCHVKETTRQGRERRGLPTTIVPPVVDQPMLWEAVA